jgi:hypothetical protein
MECCIQVMKRGIRGSNTKATTKTANNSICIVGSIGEYRRLCQNYSLCLSKTHCGFMTERNAFNVNLRQVIPAAHQLIPAAAQSPLRPRAQAGCKTLKSACLP